MKSGDIGTYWWSESVPSRDISMLDAVRNLRHHLNGLRAVNVSWDSGLSVPSDDENAKDGWCGAAAPSVRSYTDWASLVNVPTGLDLRQQLENARPHAVLGMGERLFAISLDRSLIEDFEQAFGKV